MKRLLVLLMTTLIILEAGIIGVKAKESSNSNTPFKEGKIISCGKYLFSLVSRNGEYKNYLYRTNKSGKKAKLISKSIVSPSSLYTYNKKVYYKESTKIVCYNTKTLKKSTFKNTNNDISGICSNGIIVKDYQKGLYLYTFKGKSKKIADTDYSFAGATKKYLFYSIPLRYDDSSSKVELQLYRYSLKNGAKKALASVMTSNNSSSYNYSGTCVESFHTFKKNNVFICGSYGGSAGIFVGDIYKMKSNGTKITKIKSGAENIMPGKNSVHFFSGQNLYRISSNGKISKIVKTNDDKNILTTTTSNYSVVSKHVSGSNYDLFVNRNISTSTKKKVINAKSLIKSSDPSDAYISSSIMGVVNNIALVRTYVYSYADEYGASGWRPGVVRMYNYILNVKTGKKVLI